MSISTNPFLNKIVIALGKISGGKIQQDAVRLLYWHYRNNPPARVLESKKYNDLHRADIKAVEELLSDEDSKRIYCDMIAFRETYDLRIHPGFTEDANFVRGLVKLDNEEVFIDCGAYDGDTIKYFLEYVDNKFKRIVAFEPDPSNYGKADSYIKSLDSETNSKIILHKKGISDKEKTISFRADGNECSMITNEETENVIKIEAVPLDALKECADATYIKMDIEGEEMNALRGAQGLIKGNKPKLAISIYHNDSDMTEIALYIHKLVPEYKMYVRQHSHSYYDTVLYCICD